MNKKHEEYFGTPQNLNEYSQQDLTEDAFIQRVRVDGIYGVHIFNVNQEPILLRCSELLAIAAIVNADRGWFEEYEQRNREWFGNEVAGRKVYVSLKKRSGEGMQIISLYTEDCDAWYGTPISEDQIYQGTDSWLQYLRSEWNESRRLSNPE